MDMENLSARQLAYKPVREAGVEVTRQADANYPESLRRVFVINAPKIFTFAFSMVRPLLSQVTLDKIKVFGTDREQWTEALLQDIDADQLPVHYGGTMTDPNGDPKCPSKFNMGGPVPQSHYFSCNKPVPTDDMVFATVPSGNKLKIKFEVTAPIILKWDYFTEEGDIGFHIYLKKDGKKVDLAPFERNDAHLFKEEGEIPCRDICTHVVVFDNSFSYLRSKKLWYRFTVAHPTIEEIATYGEFHDL